MYFRSYCNRLLGEIIANFVSHPHVEFVMYMNITNHHCLSFASNQYYDPICTITRYIFLQLYEDYFGQHQSILEGMQTSIRKSRRYEQFYTEFEAEKVCYLPLSAFVLKPLYRLQHYITILDCELARIASCLLRSLGELSVRSLGSEIYQLFASKWRLIRAIPLRFCLRILIT